MAGRIAASAVGEKCKVSGEMSNTTMIGFSNKAHDGFVGHSCLGRWVNIGAGTITSNLKNTYGDVSLWTPSGVRGSGMQFLGTFFGDHARTGIGTMLPTGSVIGAGANVFGGGMPPRYVPPFSWGSARGEEFEAYDLEKFIEVAARVMARRSVPFSDGVRRHYEEVYRRSRRDAMGAIGP
jgi:UDP-N-acetylglucosamine diphosphorylase/glucosamine-1-phosphate N-acetyltransferase